MHQQEEEKTNCVETDEICSRCGQMWCSCEETCPDCDEYEDECTCWDDDEDEDDWSDECPYCGDEFCDGDCEEDWDEDEDDWDEDF